jgi:hypothetical protein
MLFYSVPMNIWCYFLTVSRCVGVRLSYFVVVHRACQRVMGQDGHLAGHSSSTDI